MAYGQSAQQSVAPERQISFQSVVNWAGAAMSLALIAGIGFWGYKIIIRDVSGVPVVRAAEGPMRVQPDDPGGQQAAHQGLSVNHVAADGAAAAPADRLVLAPEPLTLSLDDTPQSAPVVEEESEPVEKVALNQSVTDEETEDAQVRAAIEALAEQLAEGVEPIEGTVEELEVEEKPELGLGKSLRPQTRPSQLSSIEQAVVVSLSSQSSAEVDADSIPVGTRLAQLGAFETPEIARDEWSKLSTRYEEYLEDKQRVVQKAQSGGRTFYRLRAMGFDDLNDARRFCSALVAEGVDCIPVVTR
ncbi:MAG: SPOR domain-containing protein [Pseudomonadota bacterium]